ncbi:MAG: hypothetical protein ABSF43_10025 [Rectinemataceae bacterium]
MIGLFIKIPFHSQLRNAEPALAAELAKAVNEVVAAFAASRHATEESFLLTFDESSRPCRLRAAEAARNLSLILSGIGPRLHGWALILDAGASSAEESLRVVKRLWFGIQGDGLYISARSKAYFADYFLFGSVVVSAIVDGDIEGKGCIPIFDAIYARPALPASEVQELAPVQAVDRLIDTLGELGVGQNTEAILAVLGPGRGPSLCIESALKKLYPDSCSCFLRFSTSAVENPPFGPVVGSFAALISSKTGVSGPGALLSGAERGLLDELQPMLDFLQRSPFRRGCSPQFGVRLRLCTAAALRFYAREMRANGLPAFVILEGIERFPESSLELVIGLVANNLDDEGLIILAAGAELPLSWTGATPRSLVVPGPKPSAIAQAALRGADAICSPGTSALLALAAAGDPLRLRLALRLLASGRSLAPAASTKELSAQALATFPQEYAELFLALRLGENTLTDECMESFLDDLGYVPGVRSPIYESLADLGFITRGLRPRIALSVASNRSEDALPDGGAAVRRDFSARLLLLRERGRIIPSVAFYRQMLTDSGRGAEDSFENCTLLLDSISADAVYGPSEPPGEDALGAALEPLTDFLRAYAASDRGSTIAALEGLEASAALSGPSVEFAEAVASLSRAAFEYADGKAQNAALRAKNALMGLHALGARKAEAKAHRILGLCSLALEQVQEGADYLSNAYEIAAAQPEPLECILAATAEAAAAFTLGDLGKAAARADAAASWASSSFRADWESACAFIKGRTSLEIGRCEEAEEYFGRVRTVARVYDQPEAARRAEIWTGRAAAFAGENMRAREVLRRYNDDAEALWFLAELEMWEGAPGKAVALADEALAIAPSPGFFSADAFDWNSGFASLEGRAVGFFSNRGYLRDQVEAFREFAAGMAAPEKDGIESASRLASLTREDRLASIHPSAHLYLFYRYLILERVTPSSMDGATALSKAFKALQMRSSRMGEAGRKEGFMGVNRWNMALIEAARGRKLL